MKCKYCSKSIKEAKGLKVVRLSESSFWACRPCIKSIGGNHQYNGSIMNKEIGDKYKIRKPDFY